MSHSYYAHQQMAVTAKYVFVRLYHASFIKTTINEGPWTVKEHSMTFNMLILFNELSESAFIQQGQKISSQKNSCLLVLRWFENKKCFTW